MAADTGGRWLAEFHADIEAIWRSDLPIHEKAVMQAYRLHVNGKTGLAWPGLSALAAMSGLSRRAVMRGRASLIARGCLEVVARSPGVVLQVRVHNPNQCLTVTSDSQSPVTIGHPGSDSQSPPPVTDSHGGGDCESPEQVRRTGKTRTGMREQGGGTPKGDAHLPISATWQRIMEIRTKAMPGTRELKLTKQRREKLRARLKEHGTDDVVLVMQWIMTSEDYRSRNLQRGGFEVDTALWASKFDKYLAHATGPVLTDDPYQRRPEVADEIPF